MEKQGAARNIDQGHSRHHSKSWLFRSARGMAHVTQTCMPSTSTIPSSTTNQHYSAAFLCLRKRKVSKRRHHATRNGTYLVTTLSMPSNPMRSTSILGPYEKRTKWWHGLSNKSRRREGFRSKKMPGTTMTFSSRQAWKKLRPSAMLSGSPSRLSHLVGFVIFQTRNQDKGG